MLPLPASTIDCALVLTLAIGVCMVSKIELRAKYMPASSTRTSDVYGLKTCCHKNVCPEMKIKVDTAKALYSVRGHILLTESVVVSNL